MNHEELSAIFETFTSKLADVIRSAGDQAGEEEPTEALFDAVGALSDYFALFVSQTSILHALLKVLHGDSAHAELAMQIENGIRDSAEAKAFEAMVNKAKFGS